MSLADGTHVRATGDIGPFVITDESGVAAGVRRIEALTGAGAVAQIQTQQAALDRTLAALGTPADHAQEAIVRLLADVKRLSRENDHLKMKLALGGSTRAEDDDIVSVGEGEVSLDRAQTIMQGAPSCTFRYKFAPR